MPLNILSLNSNGLNHPAKRHSLWQTAKKLQSDIVCVQKMHFSSSTTPLRTNSQFPHIPQGLLLSKKRGVIVAVRDTVDFHLHQELTDPNGRYIILVCFINKINYTLLNIYAPNTYQMRFLHKVLCIAQAVQKRHLVFCGDLNLVSEIHIDTTSTTKRRESPLKKFLASNDLFDVWRCHHGSERDYTYLSTHHMSYSRIDMFITDKWLLQKISASVIPTTS